MRRAANAFRALAGGDEPRVALLLPAIPQMYFALWGAETAGVACPINYLLNADHIAELIDASGANLLVALGCVIALELDVERAAAALGAEAGAPGRLERCDGPGDDVTVLGFTGISTSKAVSVTTGVVSTFIKGDFGARSEIDTDARIAPGNSGGMAIDNDANIIGIPSALFSDGAPVVSGRIRPINVVADRIEQAESEAGG